MSSYLQLYYHIVFGTKSHIPSIANIHCELLYKYIWGIIITKKCKLYRINGSTDHIHLLVDIHPSIALSKFVKDIKVSTSIWLKEQHEFKQFKGWSEGYGAFTISHSDKDSVIEYIKNQKEHHRKISYQDEYKSLLNEFGIDTSQNDLL